MIHLSQAATVNAFPNFDIVSAVLAVDVALAALNAGKSLACDI